MKLLVPSGLFFICTHVFVAMEYVDPRNVESVVGKGMVIFLLGCVFSIYLIHLYRKKLLEDTRFDITLHFQGGQMDGRSAELALMAKSSQEATRTAIKQGEKILRESGGANGCRVSVENVVEARPLELVIDRFRLGCGGTILLVGLVAGIFGGVLYSSSEAGDIKQVHTGRIVNKVDSSGRPVRAEEFLVQQEARKGSGLLVFGLSYFVFGLSVILMKSEKHAN